MNPKQTILLASMTLALCACPMSGGDDVESKISHSDDSRLVGKRDPDKLTDLTGELAKRKAEEASKVKAEVQKAQMKIFADVEKSDKPEDMANAVLKFESADEARKKMTNSPEILQKYTEIKEKCLGIEECRKVLLPDEEKDDKEKPKEPEKPQETKPEGIPEDKDRTETKPLKSEELRPILDQAASDSSIPQGDRDAIKAVSDSLMNNPEKIEEVLTTLPSSLYKQIVKTNYELVYKDKDINNQDIYHHLYATPDSLFVSVAQNGNRSLSVSKIISNDNNDFNLPSTDAITYEGDALTWSGVPVKDNPGEFEPHLLKGTLKYTVKINGTELKGSGTISNLNYAGQIKNTNGAMSVDTIDGNFQLFTVTFKTGIPSSVLGTKVEGISNTTYYADDGKVYWIKKNGDFLPNGVHGQYSIILFGKDGKHLAGKAAVDGSDIILTGESKKNP